MKRLAVLLLCALLLFSFISCDTKEYGEYILTETASANKSDNAVQYVISFVAEPTLFSRQAEETNDDPPPSDGNTHTFPKEPIFSSDYISELNEYDLLCSEFREAEFSSPEDKLRTFLEYCSPLDIVGQDNTLVMAYYSGVSNRDNIIPEAEYRNITPDELQSRKADISVYYRDLTTGEEFGYNENEVRDSASLAKLPYLLSVLEEISRFESQFDGEIDYSGENVKYDLEQKWVYNSAEMFRPGSGVIFEMNDGVEFTWEELFSFAFRNSDNIAYNQIKQRFGRESYYGLLSRLGIALPSPDERFLTAREYGLILSEAYSFMETGGRLGEFLKNEMIAAKLSNIIGMSYPQGTVAHKYGWDIRAYHDMGIIFENRPYAIVIMTDYDTGGAAVDRYFADVIRIIMEIRRNAV